MKPKKGLTAKLQVETIDDEVQAAAEEVKTDGGAESETADTRNDELATANTPKLPPNVVEVGKDRWWLRYVIAAGVLAVFTVLVAWLVGAFAAVDAQTLAERGVTLVQYRMQKWCDAFFVPGILGICFGLLIVASNGGAFDMIAYGFRTFFRLFTPDPIDRKYANFYEYHKAKRQNKRTFWYLVIVGGAYLLIAIALLVLSYVV